MDRDTWELTVDRDDCEVSLSVRIPSEEVEEFRKQAINQVRQEVDEPGFRQGKVPQSIIENKYSDVVEQQLMERIVPEAFETVYQRHDIRPVAEPEIQELDLNGEFYLEAAVETQPELEMDPEEYEALELERPGQEVDEDRVEEEIEELRSEQADLEPIPITRPIQEGDFVTLDLQGYDEDGELIEGTSGEDMIVEVGAERFLEDLEEGLVGLSEGESARIPASFPEDFVEDSLAGEDVSFQVEIKQIQEERSPDIDDVEFLDSMEVDSPEELREDVRDALQRADEEANQQHLQQQVYEQLLDRFDFPIPEGLVEQEIDSMLQQQKQQLENQGRSFEEYLNEQDQTEEDLRAELEEDARRRIKITFILGRIAEQEDIEVEEQEVQEEIRSIASQYGMEPAQLEENFDDQVRTNIRFQLRDEKVVQYLIRNADVTEVDPEQLESTESDEE